MLKIIISGFPIISYFAIKLICSITIIHIFVHNLSEMMYMVLFVHVVDETLPDRPSQHLKVRTACDLSIRDSLENVLGGNSDDFDYELVGVPLHEKAAKFKVMTSGAESVNDPHTTALEGI